MNFENLNVAAEAYQDPATGAHPSAAFVVAMLELGQGLVDQAWEKKPDGTWIATAFGDHAALFVIQQGDRLACQSWLVPIDEVVAVQIRGLEKPKLAQDEYPGMAMIRWAVTVRNVGEFELPLAIAHRDATPDRIARRIQAKFRGGANLAGA